MIDLTQNSYQDYLVGQFMDRTQQSIFVIFHIPNAGTLKRIGGRSYEEADVYFSGDSPVEITTEVSDTFDVSLMKMCTVNLLVKKHLALLFTGDPRKIICNVFRRERQGTMKLLFAGFVEPNIYNQPYVDNYDSLSVTCTDALATCQYYPYRQLQTKSQYDEYKNQADKITFEAIISNILGKLPNLNLLSDTPNSIYYDGSVRPSENAHPTSIFTDVNVYELLFLGEDKDDLLQENEVLDEVLKYLSLHIIQQGADFFIFSWASIKNRQTIDFYPMCISDAYYVSSSKMIIFEGEARELLVNVSDDSDTLPGNLLDTEYENDISYLNGKYVNYEVSVLPDNSKARTGNWRYADLSDWPFLDAVDSSVYVLAQDAEGNYNIEELRLAPEQCFDASGNFIYSTYNVIDNDYTVIE